MVNSIMVGLSFSAIVMMSSILGARAQQLTDSGSDTVTSIQFNSILGSLSSSTAVAATTSTSSSYYHPSSVPFNTGPDPFPIVLPSTVTLSSTLSMVTASTSSAASLTTTDPYSLETPSEAHTVSADLSESTSTETVSTSTRHTIIHTSEIGNPTVSGSSGAEQATNAPTSPSDSSGYSIMKCDEVGKRSLFMMCGILVGFLATEITLGSFI